MLDRLPSRRGTDAQNPYTPLATCCVLTFENAVGRFFGVRCVLFPNLPSQSLGIRNFITGEKCKDESMRNSLLEQALAGAGRLFSGHDRTRSPLQSLRPRCPPGSPSTRRPFRLLTAARRYRSVRTYAKHFPRSLGTVDSRRQEADVATVFTDRYERPKTVALEVVRVVVHGH